MNKTKDENISEALAKYKAFFAFGNKQFDEAKEDGVKYSSLGMGLVCPTENCKQLVEEINEIVKEHKKQEKANREERAKVLKIEQLPKAERIQNRKILIGEAVARIQNFMDCDVVQEAINELQEAQVEAIGEAINYVLNCIDYRYNDRASEADVKEVYDIDIQNIKELKSEIINILKE